MDFVMEFKKLLFATPTYNLRSVHNTNCPYVHMVSYSKDSYMCFGGYKCEDCGYCHYPNQLRDCWDTYFAIKCELCYECVSCTQCYSCNFCAECVNCTDCQFCYDCRGCKNCFGCVGLRQKEFYVFNQSYSKEAYVQKMKELRLRNPADIKQHFEAMERLREKHPHIASVQTNTQNCVGDHIINSKNCSWAFATTESEDCCYVFHNDHLKDSMDTDLMAASELIYECTPGYDLYNCNFCLECGNTKNAEFCVRVFNSHDCFGCVGRDHAEFEILNQKYPKDEYFKRVAQMKDQLKSEKKYTNWLPDVVGEID